jgi:glutaredoxin-dependent peroxiredoxin
MSLRIGDQAPGFTLYDTEKKQVSLEDYKGRNLLLLFFPLAFTSVCTAELCGVRDNISMYQNTEAAVIGISVDSLYTLSKFRQEQQLNFPLLSDFNKTVSSAYDSLYPSFGYGMEGVSKRSAFVIDRQGIIRYAEVLENAGEQPNFLAIQSQIKELM